MNDPTPPRQADQLDQAAAATLLYAAITGQRGESSRIVRGLLPLHRIHPGPGSPDPDCAGCHGTGLVAPPGSHREHCHCGCDLCECGDALCAGPCEAVAVLLDVLVLRGMPAEAVDVPRTLARLHLDAVSRIVTGTCRGARTVIELAERNTDAIVITIGDRNAAELAEGALSGEGYRCELHELQGRRHAVRLIAKYRH